MELKEAHFERKPPIEVPFLPFIFLKGRICEFTATKDDVAAQCSVHQKHLLKTPNYLNKIYFNAVKQKASVILT